MNWLRWYKSSAKGNFLQNWDLQNKVRFVSHIEGLCPQYFSILRIPFYEEYLSTKVVVRRVNVCRVLFFWLWSRNFISWRLEAAILRKKKSKEVHHIYSFIKKVEFFFQITALPINNWSSHWGQIVFNKGMVNVAKDIAGEFIKSNLSLFGVWQKVYIRLNVYSLHVWSVKQLLIVYPLTNP